MRRDWKRRLETVLILGLLCLATGVSLLLVQLQAPARITWGATVSAHHARALGLDPVRVVGEVMDGLHMRTLRLPLYWHEVERVQGEYDFAEMDAMLEAVGKRGGKALVAVGMRVPRYPECFVPDWYAGLDAAEKKEALLRYVATVLHRYSDHTAIEAWQIENEPLLPGFGDCPEPSYALLQDEVALARMMTEKPIVVTASGEWGNWSREAAVADKLGVSMYREARFGEGGAPLVPYPASPLFYRLRALFLQPRVPVFVSELQMEPWFRDWVSEIPLEEQLAAMNPVRMRETVQFARQAGFATYYVWGVEWWLWLRDFRGLPELWGAAQEIFSQGK